MAGAWRRQRTDKIASFRPLARLAFSLIDLISFDSGSISSLSLFSEPAGSYYTFSFFLDDTRVNVDHVCPQDRLHFIWYSFPSSHLLEIDTDTLL